MWLKAQAYDRMSLVEAIKDILTRDGEVRRYHCRHCGEVFESFDDPESVNCPVCGHDHVRTIATEE